MSLLMDALKKAEQEKKRAAKQLREVEEPAEAESMPESEQELNTEPGDISINKQRSAIEKLELTLEPLGGSLEDSIDDSKDSHFDPTQGAEQLDRTHDEAGDSFSEDLTIENTVENELPDESLEATQEAVDLDDTSVIEGLSVESASAPFDDTFHGVILEDEEESDVYEETLPGVSADQLAKDLGGGVYQPTPVAAKTVFSATGASPKKKSFKWGIFSILVLLAVGSFGVFYYFSITPVARQMPSPAVARGIEATSVPLPAIPEVAEDNISGTLIEQQPDSGAMAEEMRAIVNSGLEEQPAAITQEETPVSDVPSSVSEALISEAVEATVQETTEETTQQQIVAEEVSPEETSVEAETTPDEGLIAAEEAEPEVMQEEIAAPATLPDTIEVDPRAIQISKYKQPEKRAVIVNEAFKAFNAGQYDTARSLYLDAIRLQPDSRDAHLGLGAIAIKNNDPAAAYSHYAVLLKLNPDDALALSAIQSLYQSPDPVRDESAIKLLLQKEGDVPYLYFNLGNIYARQQRWPEAQQAFFDAYRLDTSNADYVLNLAISLDHLQQYPTAYDYYQTALDLALQSNSNIDFVSVKKRVDTLSQLVEPQL